MAFYPQEIRSLPLLGTGTFGNVYETPDRKALKVYERRFKNGQMEAFCLNKIKKHNVPHVPLFDRSLTFLTSEKTIYCIKMEKIEQTLSSKIKDPNTSFSEIKSLFKKILECLEHLHHVKIVHKDIKPENISLCGKLFDYSLSSQGKDLWNNKISSTCQYRAPESTFVNTQKTWIGPPSDLYSLGIVIHNWITAQKFFPILDIKLNETGSLQEVINGEYFKINYLECICKRYGLTPKELKEIFDENQDIFDNYQDFFSKNEKGETIFSNTPEKRCSNLSNFKADVTTACQKKNVSDNEISSLIELLFGLLELNPYARKTAKEALNHKFFHEGEQDVSFHIGSRKPFLNDHLIIRDKDGSYLFEKDISEIKSNNCVHVAKKTNYFVQLYHNGKLKTRELSSSQISPSLNLKTIFDGFCPGGIHPRNTNVQERPQKRLKKEQSNLAHQME